MRMRGAGRGFGLFCGRLGFRQRPFYPVTLGGVPVSRDPTVILGAPVPIRTTRPVASSTAVSSIS